MDKRAIGYMDSGVGGLTVVKQALKELHDEAVVYLGDTLRMPYGPRPQAEVRDFTWQMTDFLLQQDIKLLVVACNTATAAALPELQAKLSIPVVGVIQPGIDQALAQTNGHVGVLATEGTVKSEAYYRGLKDGNPAVDVIQHAAPEFVTLVESGDFDTPAAMQIVTDKLTYFKAHPVDTLIMGCTHFPLLEKLIQQAMGGDVTLVNAGAAAVDVVKQYLEERDLANVGTPITNEYYTTGDADHFKQIAEQWLETSDLQVQHIKLGDSE